MITFDFIRGAVADSGAAGVTTPRPNEVHCEVTPDAIGRLAELAVARLGAELILIAAEHRGDESFVVHYLFGHPDDWFLHASTPLDPRAPAIASLAAHLYPASRFERELRDLFGIRVLQLPDPSPIVKHGFWPADYHPLRKDAASEPFVDRGEPFPFTQVGGEGVYEIPVGPVHAGVIEPGHFRFSVLGETVINLRTRLYFTHKGTEKLFEGRAPADGVELAERISGDTTVGHALAYCQAVEASAGVTAPERARLLRVVLLELERLYNHVGDVGAIVNDTGFAVGHAHCFRVREELLRLNKALTGSRLLRGTLAPGGLARDLEIPSGFLSRLTAALADFEETVAICLENTLLMDRLEEAGILSAERALDHGALGYVARASGRDIDARRDHPCAEYSRLEFRVPVHAGGDVKARTMVRIEETRESLSLVAQACRRLAAGPVRADVPRLPAFAPAFGLVEGWRGRIVHWLSADAEGRLHRVKIVDPSFFNWPALSYCLEGNIVPDFPLCNKSFNQSYSGNDL